MHACMHVPYGVRYLTVTVYACTLTVFVLVRYRTVTVYTCTLTVYACTVTVCVLVRYLL